MKNARSSDWKRFLGLLFLYVTAISVTGFVVMPATDYNCHSLAWHDGWGDRTDPNNSWCKPWWDECPCDDMKNAERVKIPAPGDVVVYGTDSDCDGLEHGEILHSGRYLGRGWVESKLGSGPILFHQVNNCLADYGNDIEFWRKAARRTAADHRAARAKLRGSA